MNKWKRYDKICHESFDEHDVIDYFNVGGD